MIYLKMTLDSVGKLRAFPLPYQFHKRGTEEVPVRCDLEVMLTSETKLNLAANAVLGVEGLVEKTVCYSYTGSRLVVFSNTNDLAEEIFKKVSEPTVADRKSTRLNSSHVSESRMPSSA
mgnify:CR=1 FL=1